MEEKLWNPQVVLGQKNMHNIYYVIKQPSIHYHKLNLPEKRMTLTWA